MVSSPRISIGTAGPGSCTGIRLRSQQPQAGSLRLLTPSLTQAQAAAGSLRPGLFNFKLKLTP